MKQRAGRCLYKYFGIILPAWRPEKHDFMLRLEILLSLLRQIFQKCSTPYRPDYE